ncbi:MAG TPA: von Willebrand factor type A domain-containing protein [Opitutaceae bacterium]|nr:von Willebrand factor type A domain-containing protein [Opitutaceae bacterium]
MNDKPLSPNDPRLTAYALGELEAPERAAVEEALAANPALRAAVEEIRATAAQLETALAAEPAPSVSAVIVPQPPRSRVVRFPVAYYIIGGLAAAGFAVLVVRYEPPARVVREEAQPSYTEIRLDQGRESAAAVQDKETPLPPASAPAPAPVAVPAVAEAKAWSGGTGGFPAVDSLPPATVSLSGAMPQASSPSEQSRIRGLAPTNDTVTLSPFEVNASKDTGYYAQNTLSGTRLNTKIEDRSSSISVVTKQQLSDARALDIADVFTYQRNAAAAKSEMATVKVALPAPPTPNTETYGLRQDNQFVAVASEPLSTFSIDVDSAGYSNVRRFLQSGQLPPRDAVRLEELVNYFPYRYAPPSDNQPFAATMEVAAAPWDPRHRLVRIGLKGREVASAARPAANLVFLLDVSGSMNQPNKLPLVKESLRLLLGQLRGDDRVAIVTYAGQSGLALPSTPVTQSREIAAALDGLEAFGGTNGGMGIQLAYDIAKANFVPGGVNRVILCTDGDFNLGVTNQGDLLRMIEEKAKSNVFLTVLGFGYGNLKDSTLELLADKGNGHYGYIDTRREAEKMLVEQVQGTLVTIAKDVKVQVEFNPAQASAYRLLGYENRLLKKEEFNDDKVDAGEIGAGHTVTALYEVIPAGADEKIPETSVDALKYQKTDAAPSRKVASANPPPATRTPQSQELLTVKIRYKEPAGTESRKLEFPLTDRGADFAAASADFKFAAAVAGFGLALREQPAKASLLADSIRWAEAGRVDDAGGYRAEFIGLLHQAQMLAQ